MKGVYYGWYMLAGASLMNAFGGTIVWQGFAVFFIPVSESLGITYWQTSLAFALARAENGVLGPITGWALDRFGYMPLILGGTIITGVGYIILSQAETYIAFMLVYLFVISIGSSTSFMQATTAALNTWFIRYRGLVMSINSAAFRAGGAIMIPLISVGVLNLGWQTTSWIIGAALIVFIAPLAFLFRRSPESMGLNPDGGVSLFHMRRRLRRNKRAQNQSSAAEQADDAQTSGSNSNAEGDFTTKQALKTPSFWILVLATTLRMSVHGTIFLHFIPILVWRGETQQTSANLVGLISLSAVPVILFTGYISDRVGRPLLLTILYSASAVSLLSNDARRRHLADLHGNASLHRLRSRQLTQLGHRRRPLRTRSIRHHTRHDGTHLQPIPHHRPRRRWLHLRPTRHLPTRPNRRHRPHVHRGASVLGICNLRFERRADSGKPKFTAYGRHPNQRIDPTSRMC